MVAMLSKLQDFSHVLALKSRVGQKRLAINWGISVVVGNFHEPAQHSTYIYICSSHEQPAAQHFTGKVLTDTPAHCLWQRTPLTRTYRHI